MNNISKKDIENMKSLIAAAEDKKERADFSKRVVFGVICFVVLFSIAVLFVFLKTGAEPTVLVGSVMAFASVELWSLSKIKRGRMIMNIEIMSKVIIPILGAIVVYVIVPFIKSKTTKEQRDNAYFYVKIAVTAAEQIYKEKGKGELKKEYVVEYIQRLGFKIDMADLEVMIEAAVLELKNI